MKLQQALLNVFLLVTIGCTETEMLRPGTDFPRRLTLSANEPPILEGTSIKPFYNSYISYEVLKLLSGRLNFTYTLKPPSDLLYGTLVNGSWTGIMGQVYRKEVDMGVQTINVNYVRYQAAEGTYPILFDTGKIMIPVPQEDGGLLAPLQPFSLQVWLALVASLAAITLCAKFSMGSASKTRLGDTAMSTLSLFTGQSFCYVSYARNTPVRLVLTGGCLAAVILINSYTTILFSILTIPRYTPVINSVEDLVTSTILPATAKGTIYEILFMNANDGLFKMIGNRMRKHPYVVLDKISDGKEPVAKGQMAYVLAGRYLDSLIYDDYKEHGYCRLTKAKKGFDTITFGFLLQKKSPLANPINYQILLMHEHGFIDYFETHVKMQSPCSSQTQKASSGVKAIPLKQLGSIFIVYCLGTVAASLAFLVEVNVKKRSK